MPGAQSAPSLDILETSSLSKDFESSTKNGIGTGFIWREVQSHELHGPGDRSQDTETKRCALFTMATFNFAFPQKHTPAAWPSQSELSSLRAACTGHSAELEPPQFPRQTLGEKMAVVVATSVKL